MTVILTLNGGSSSLKAALFSYDEDGTQALLLEAAFSAIGNQPTYKIHCHKTAYTHTQSVSLSEGKDAYKDGLLLLQKDMSKHLNGIDIDAIGHRIVHGGNLNDTQAITDDLVSYLTSLTPLAPLHQGANLALYHASKAMWPKAEQWACCDTVFHTSQPKIEQAYAIPDSWYQKGVRRYGFHGLSYGYIASQLAKLGTDQQKTIIAHLGAGASLCALENGKSIASTMGFTATDGIPMATRSGAIDPGVLLFLERNHHMSPSDIERLLNKESGLLGLSGISGDIRTLHDSQNPKAAFAIDLFCYRIASEIACLSSTTQGLEQLVFTAGIGENDALIRSAIAKRCEWLGAVLDEDKNKRNDCVISSKDSRVTIRVIPTNEEAYIANEVAKQQA